MRFYYVLYKLAIAKQTEQAGTKSASSLGYILYRFQNIQLWLLILNCTFPLKLVSNVISLHETILSIETFLNSND